MREYINVYNFSQRPTTANKKNSHYFFYRAVFIFISGLLASCGDSGKDLAPASGDAKEEIIVNSMCYDTLNANISSFYQADVVEDPGRAFDWLKSNGPLGFKTCFTKQSGGFLDLINGETSKSTYVLYFNGHGWVRDGEKQVVVEQFNDKPDPFDSIPDPEFGGIVVNGVKIDFTSIQANKTSLLVVFNGACFSGKPGGAEKWQKAFSHIIKYHDEDGKRQVFTHLPVYIGWPSKSSILLNVIIPNKFFYYCDGPNRKSVQGALDASINYADKLIRDKDTFSKWLVFTPNPDPDGLGEIFIPPKLFDTNNPEFPANKLFMDLDE